MDDKDKSVVDKFKETVSEAVGNMGSAMTASPKEDSKNAGTTNEQVYMPEATDAAAMPAPLFAAPARKRKTRAKAKTARKAAKKTTSSGRKAAAKKRSTKKVAKKRKAKR